ncbi:hypothetical protein ACOMHN_045212 [Nucella lapillus]
MGSSWISLELLVLFLSGISMTPMPALVKQERFLEGEEGISMTPMPALVEQERFLEGEEGSSMPAFLEQERFLQGKEGDLSRLIDQEGRELGQEEGRLLGGEAATDSDFERFSFAVEVGYNFTSNWNNKTSQIYRRACAGILYDFNVILTNAHCAQYYMSYLTYAQCGKKNGTTQRVQVDSVTIHPSYNNSASTFLANDIAVVKLSTSFQADSHCSKAVLPSSSSANFFNQEVTVFGMNTTLWRRYWFLNQYVTTDQLILPESNCSAVFGSYLNSSMHVCIIDNQTPKQQAACRNDHGTPATLSDNTVVGLGSWMTRGCLFGYYNYPTVYTRLANYLDWFESFKVLSSTSTTPSPILP